MPKMYRRFPMARPRVSIIWRYVRMSGPPMSKVAPAVSGAPALPTRYPRTSRSAMGWQRDSTHRGVTMTGRRSTSCLSISHDAPPWPRMMAARSVVVATSPDSRMRPVSARLRRCSDSSGPVSPRPPK